MPWWLHIAIKQLFPSGRIVSFFAVVSILGVALGVLGLFGTQSVMNGFHEKLGEKMRDTTGDVIISQGGRAFRNYGALLEKLSARPEIESAEACANGPVMMVYGNTPLFPVLRSYDTLRAQSVLPIAEKNYVRQGDISNLDDDGIIIGIGFAQSMRISVGDEVQVYSPAMLDRISQDEVPLPATLKVVGFLCADYSAVDKSVAIVSLRRLQELYGIEGGAYQILLRLKDGVSPEKFAAVLNAELPGSLSASTWLESNEAFLSVIKMEKTMMSLIILLIIIVASFSICISLYTSVLRKTREIGLMGAMGARPRQVIFMYCLQGLFIGVIGSIVGLIFTVCLLHFREGIAELIVGRENLVDFYFFSKLPVKYDLSDALKACAFASFLCTLAGFIPALFAARLKPSEAMRNE